MTLLKNKWEAFLLNHSYAYCPMNVYSYSYNYYVLAVAYIHRRHLRSGAFADFWLCYNFDLRFVVQ